jgi:hypothetical protein
MARFREAFSDEGELPGGEDVGRQDSGHWRLLGKGRTPPIVSPPEF